MYCTIYHQSPCFIYSCDGSLSISSYGNTCSLWRVSLSFISLITSLIVYTVWDQSCRPAPFINGPESTTKQLTLLLFMSMRVKHSMQSNQCCQMVWRIVHKFCQKVHIFHKKLKKVHVFQNFAITTDNYLLNFNNH